MNAKSILTLITCICLAKISGAQSIREKIDRQARNPKLKEAAARADVYIAGNKSIVYEAQRKMNEWWSKNYKGRC